MLARCSVPATFLDWTTHNQLLGRLKFGYYNMLIVGSKERVPRRVVILLLRVVDLGASGVIMRLDRRVAPRDRRLAARDPPRGAMPHLDQAALPRMVSYGRKSQFGSIFQFLNARFDVFILQFFVPLASIGYYIVAQFLVELVMVLTRSFQSSVTSLVTRDADDPLNQAATTSTSIRHHGLLCLAALAVNAVFSPLLIVFVYGAAFRPAILPFFIILPGIWFLATGLLIANDLNGRNRPGLASTLSGLGVGVTSSSTSR